MNAKRNLVTLAFLAAWTAMAAGAMAQPAGAAAPLADKLPEQSLLYLGWGGLGPNKAALNATGIGRLLDDPEVKPHVEAMVAQLESFIKKQGERNLPPGAYAPLRSLLLDVVAERPWAVTLIDLKPPGPDGPPVVQVALLVDAGDGADAAMANADKLLKAFLPAEMQQQIQDVQVGGAALKSLLPEKDGPPILWGVYKRHLLAAISQEAAAMVVAVLNGDRAALSANPQFAKVLAKTGGGMCCLYGDVARFRKDLLPAVLAMNIRNEDERAQVNRVLSAVGLDAIDAIGAAARPDGRDFLRTAYVLAPRGKPGLLVLADQKPISTDLLAAVPADATFAMVANFNRPRIMDELDKQLAAFPEAKAQFDQMRKSLEDAAGLNLRTDLAEAVGDGIAIYNSPSAGGFLFTGLTVVAELKDPAKIKSAMPKLIDAFLGQLAQADPDIKEKVAFKKGTFRGKEYEYLTVAGLPVPVAPSWCVTEKYLVFSLFPQTLKSALVQLEVGRAGSLLDNPWLAAQLAGPGRGASAVSYVNQKQLLRIAYPAVLPLWQVACSMAAGQGIHLDVNALPRQELLLKHVGDSFAAMVPDPEGVLCVGRSSSPLPSVMGTLLTNPMLTASVLLPAIGKATHDAKVSQSLHNLSWIGGAIHTYNVQHNGRYPDSLQELVDKKLIAPELLVSPLQKGPGQSYIYIKPGAHEPATSTQIVVAYERPENLDNEATNVLFVDGHSQHLMMPEFNDRLEQTKKEWAQTSMSNVRSDGRS